MESKERNFVLFSPKVKKQKWRLVKLLNSEAENREKRVALTQSTLCTLKLKIRDINNTFVALLNPTLHKEKII